jgi:hypothetical protein
VRRTWSRSPWLLSSGAVLALLGCLFLGCQAMLKSLSNHLTHWDMLGQEATEDPLKAVGGQGVVFAPPGEDRPVGREQLARATPRELVAYYAPVFVQQHPDAAKQRYPYPPEYDDIGEAELVRDGAKYKAVVAGRPTVYAIYQKRPIEGHDHIQLTYTAWYPAHPRMKMIDLEEADIDSCVVRVTLDGSNAPLFFETIAACGCFHKVFVDKRLEDAAVKSFGTPEKGKKFCIQKTIDEGIDWEVAGVVDEPADRPRRPVVFVKAGDHKVIGMGCAARLRVPPKESVHSYLLTDYADLYSVQVKDSQERKPFFDLGKGGKVWGAERKEGLLFKLAGVDAAGQPRANDQIKMHFDQSTWDDVSTYKKYLRLPDGTL